MITYPTFFSPVPPVNNSINPRCRYLADNKNLFYLQQIEHWSTSSQHNKQLHLISTSTTLAKKNYFSFQQFQLYRPRKGKGETSTKIWKLSQTLKNLKTSLFLAQRRKLYSTDIMHLNALINWNWENPSLLQQTSDFNSAE